MKSSIWKKPGKKGKLLYALSLYLSVVPVLHSQSSLSQLLEAMVAPLSMPSTEEGPGWRRWEVSGQPWGNLLAFAGESAPEQPRMLVGMQDTLPLLALFAGKAARQYQFMKIDKSLAQGWSMVLRASGEGGQVDWVEMSKGDKRAIVASQPGKAIPQFLILPDGRETFLILSWDASGAAFEHILLYSLPERSVIACARYGLNASAMDYLFLRGEGGTWVEYTFRSERPEPVAVAIHNKVPGNLSKAAWDLDKDGRMDILGEFSPLAPQATYRRVEGPAGSGQYAQVNALKKEMAALAREGNELWLEGQWAWWKLQPLGVVLPEVAGR